MRMRPVGNRTYVLRLSLAAGRYEYKATAGASWHENYGAGGEKNGANLALTLQARTEVAFVFVDAMRRKQLIAWHAGESPAALEGAGWAVLDALFAYDGDDLGAVYAGGSATLKLWAPTATAATAVFYDRANPERRIGALPMRRVDRGVWTAEAAPEALGTEDLRGYYYQYEVLHGRQMRRVLDPYAKSMAPFRTSPSGVPLGRDKDAAGKAAIVELAGTDPEGGLGWSQIDGYESREDAVIYEVHVRDFTSDPAIEGELGARWGTFGAFAERLDYIRSLGVTHVQLLPVMAWYYGDETEMGERELEYAVAGNRYNWGYDPHGYFAPDGAYSADPGDPELRIRELKALIAAIHEAGMGVILDVVYTHMARHQLLSDIVPDYYFYQTEQGKLLGGFGNNLATNHRMAEKLMLDSVAYWFREYKIDGMRWDMMGDATYPALQRAYDVAASLHPQPLFIGEGWRTFSGDLAEPELAGLAADQDWMDKTDAVGVFADELRDELKAGFGSEGEPRFLTGGPRSVDTLLRNLKAQPYNTPADAPGDMVHYIEAHDNLTLHDVIALTLHLDPDDPAGAREIQRRIRLGQVLLFTSQGTAFLHAGQEYGRTKRWRGAGRPPAHTHRLHNRQGRTLGYFVHNSYNASDAVNRFEWDRATDASAYPECARTLAYTRGLIRLRRASPVFRLRSRAEVDRCVTRLVAPEIGEEDLLIAYRCEAPPGSAVPNHTESPVLPACYYVFVNADTRTRTVSLETDLTRGEVLVDAGTAGTDAIVRPSGLVLTPRAVTLDALSAVVIRVS
ncbi:hypothetical protein IDH44_20520 [Paenibacillus sp. IB182496]|uniref:Glycosyl hydrolase family 13 catalytic domain-containing protein n=2 Tax=Paenibacillus sabuli TaxID=2772509 RepID=A0A927BX96_9BACL|nr:hypothetical protein [Paenibacillus sabuli]